MKFLGVVIVASVLAAPALGQIAPSQLRWPAPVLPRDATAASLGDDLTINGIPARVYTFSTRERVDVLVAQFREYVRTDFTRAPAHPVHADRTLVAGRVDDFWVTLQLESADGRTRGTWSATPHFISDARQSVVRPVGFPPSARVIQQVDSFDAGQRSQMAMGIDPSPVAGVAARLEEELHAEGFRKQALPAVNWPAPDRYVAVFSKAREEIWITLQQRKGGTAVTVNRLSALEMLE